LLADCGLLKASAKFHRGEALRIVNSTEMMQQRDGMFLDVPHNAELSPFLVRVFHIIGS
jgi:hypothetical protein